MLAESRSSMLDPVINAVGLTISSMLIGLATWSMIGVLGWAPGAV